MRKLTSLIAIGSFIVVAGIVVFFRAQLFPSLFHKNPVAENAASHPEVSNGIRASDSSLAEARPCLVLHDSIRMEGPNPGLLNTGDVYTVSGIEVAGGGQKRYRGGSEATKESGSIDANSCLLFDDRDLFDNFLLSTAENSEVFNRSLEQLDPNSGKSALLNTSGFYARVLCNANAKDRFEWAADKWFLNVDADSIGIAVSALSYLPIADPDVVDPKLSLHLSESQRAAVDFIAQAGALPEAEKTHLVNRLCPVFMEPELASGILLDALKPIASEAYQAGVFGCMEKLGPEYKARIMDNVTGNEVFKSANPDLQKRVRELL